MTAIGNILVECECCHDEFPLALMTVTSAGVHCRKCLQVANAIPPVSDDELLLLHKRKLHSDNPLYDSTQDVPGSPRPQEGEAT